MTNTLTTAPERPEPAPPRAWRPSTVLAVLALVVGALFGGNVLDVRDHVLGSPTAAPARVARARQVGGSTATTAVAPAPPDKTVLRSQPWWQGVTTLKGTGTTTTAPFTVDSGAIQWRVTWRCDTGHLTVTAPNRAKAVVDGVCPSGDVGYGTAKGSVALNVVADGAWQLHIDQQIDVPLDEPPLPAMTAPGATLVSSGDFYRVDQVGQGKVTIYRLANGTYALRLDGFYVTPNTDLEIRLSPIDAPKSTQQFAAAASESVSSLDVTAGSMNFNVPPDVNPRQYRSVVIWCDRLYSAYAAASLS